MLQYISFVSLSQILRDCENVNIRGWFPCEWIM